MKIDKACKTCEFNFQGVCSEGGFYKYGEKILDENEGCCCWGVSDKYFSEIIENMPWYIKDTYNRRLDFNEVLKKLEEDETANGTEINIYEAIVKVYNISYQELAEILGVKVSVIVYARRRGTIYKRKKAFSSILCIPEKYFDEFYSKQLYELEKCRDMFYSRYQKN